jgi:hypothetical protein
LSKRAEPRVSIPLHLFKPNVPSRIFSALIVSFWIVMTVLLVRLEVNPGKSDLLDVPPSHVFKLMFMHEQISQLDIVEDGKPVGTLMLHPKNETATRLRSLIFTGSLSTTLPGAAKKQRITWDGILEMDQAFGTRSLEFTVNLQEPPSHLHAKLDSVTGRADYEVTQDGHTLSKSSIPMTQEGVAGLLRDQLGIDPSILQNVPAAVSRPMLTARQTELDVHKEKIIAYKLSLMQGETTLADIYVSQLGQILTAKTLPGYNLYTEDMMPTHDTDAQP